MEGILDYVNWPEQFPDKPEVRFSIKAAGNILKVHFSVKEDKTLARATADFDEVWRDSCCELFIMFEGEDKYYNLETSCNGYQIFSYRPGRQPRENAGKEVMSRIISRTSIEKHSVFEARHIDEWTLDLEIPADAFWRSGIKDFSSIKAKGNVYKCIEAADRKHFLSWAPISSPGPDFHRPEFFREFDF